MHMTRRERIRIKGQRARKRIFMRLNIPSYPFKHSGTLLILGSAENALEELKEAQRMRSGIMIMTVGHAAGLIKADFIVSDHYEVHEELRKLQNVFGVGHFSSHCAFTGHLDNHPEVDYWWHWRRSEASSVQTAIRIGMKVGFQEIILCGCPLQHGFIQHPLQIKKDGIDWPPKRDTKKYGRKDGLNTSEEILSAFRFHFKNFSREWKGIVFSMSGYTKEVLGEPLNAPEYEIPILVKKAIDQWNGKNGMRLLYPKRHGVWPMGDSPDAIAEYCKGKVCEVGCGNGRCSMAFKPEQYIGVDINKNAIQEAKKLYPEYKFETIGWYDSYPKADTYLFYTVMLHIPDDELLSVFKKIESDKRIVIFETMMKEYRNKDRGNYQRNIEDYTKVVNRVGRKVLNLIELPSNATLPKRHFMVVK